MERILEPELMKDPKQVEAYAAADFSDSTELFVTRFRNLFGDGALHVLDLGSGPASVLIKLAQSTWCNVTGIEGSKAMVRYARERVKEAGLRERIQIRNANIWNLKPTTSIDVLISKDLIHHLKKPERLWERIKNITRPNTPFMMMDLFRPNTPEEARSIVEALAKNAAEILKRDFLNSLHAALTPNEVIEQLKAVGLKATVQKISPRHMLIEGKS